MILNNLKILRAYAENNTYNNKDHIISPSLLKDTSGNYIDYDIWHGLMNTTGALVNNRFFKYNLKVLFGSGNTEPAVTDYALGNNFTASLSDITYAESYEVTNDNDEPKIVKTIEIIGRNNTENDLILREFGLYQDIYYDMNHSSPVLLVREVLSTPITLEAGKGFALTITWEES